MFRLLAKRIRRPPKYSIIVCRKFIVSTFRKPDLECLNMSKYEGAIKCQSWLYLRLNVSPVMKDDMMIHQHERRLRHVINLQLHFRKKFLQKIYYSKSYFKNVFMYLLGLKKSGSPEVQYNSDFC